MFERLCNWILNVVKHVLWVVWWLVDVGLFQCGKESIPGDSYGKLWCGKFHLWHQVQSPWVPCVPSLPYPLWKNSNLVFTRPCLHRANVRKFCAMPGLVHFSPSPHLVSWVCIPGCALAGTVSRPSLGACSELSGTVTGGSGALPLLLGPHDHYGENVRVNRVSTCY